MRGVLLGEVFSFSFCLCLDGIQRGVGGKSFRESWIRVLCFLDLTCGFWDVGLEYASVNIQCSSSPHSSTSLMFNIYLLGLSEQF